MNINKFIMTTDFQEDPGYKCPDPKTFLADGVSWGNLFRLKIFNYTKNY
jgi:hypothetical protein